MSITSLNKEKLDSILEEYKAQPVGDGYIDIIISRENYKPFARMLIENGLFIEAISWWEYMDDPEKLNTYGMGGSRSKFYTGWFAEVGGNLDKIPESNDALTTIIEIIENKVLGEYNGKYVSFHNTKSLIPAFWLSIDESWKNK